jgi:hypothetical protein
MEQSQATPAVLRRQEKQVPEADHHQRQGRIFGCTAWQRRQRTFFRLIGLPHLGQRFCFSSLTYLVRGRT